MVQIGPLISCPHCQCAPPLQETAVNIFFFFGEFGFQGIVRRTYSTNKVQDIGQPTPATHPQVLLLNTHLHMRFLCLVHALGMSRYKLAII